MTNIEQKADQAATQHTVFMALAQLAVKLDPSIDIQDYLNELIANKRAEKARILSAIDHENQEKN